jgi:hypothetical protein
MNLNSCLSCHAYPAPGGSSPESNPQISFWKDSLDHSANKLPSFITEKGPAREARFKLFREAEYTGPDGGVHDLFTIAGMKGAERLRCARRGTVARPFCSIASAVS